MALQTLPNLPLTWCTCIPLQYLLLDITKKETWLQYSATILLCVDHIINIDAPFYTTMQYNPVGNVNLMPGSSVTTGPVQCSHRRSDGRNIPGRCVNADTPVQKQWIRLKRGGHIDKGLKQFFSFYIILRWMSYVVQRPNQNKLMLGNSNIFC